MPAAVFAAISPFPPFPAILLVLLLLAPATADAPGDGGKKPKTPTIFKKSTRTKTPGISRETAGERTKERGFRLR